MALVGGCTQPNDDQAQTSSGQASARLRTASDVLTRLTAAWHSGDESAAAALAPAGEPLAGRRLALAARNARLLGLRNVQIVTGEAASDAPVSGRLTWRMPGARGASSVPVALTWTQSPGGLELASLTSSGGVTPLWLTEPLMVSRLPGLVVVGSTKTDLAPIRRTAERAQTRVKQALPGWDGHVVVEVPSSQDVLTRILSGAPSEYDGIAAVTTSTDGSAASSADIHIFLNPEIYGAMDPVAADIVMAHEVVHVATRAPTTPVPLWWSEGLAEYLAFSGAEDSASGLGQEQRMRQRLRDRSRAQLVAALKAGGVPRELPTSEDFSGPGRDAAYESARIACGLLASFDSSHDGSGGRRSLVEFQDALAGGVGTGEALRRVFGLSRQSFLARWRTELSRLARTT
jgi:hypothetical protein